MTRPFVIIVVLLGLSGMFLILYMVSSTLFREGTPISSLSLNDDQQQTLKNNQFTLLLARQQSLLLRTQRRDVFLFILSILTVIFVATFGSMGALFVYRKSRPTARTISEYEDGVRTIFEIPIMRMTREERILLATAQLARNAALAQGDSTTLAIDMLKAVAQTAKSFQGFVPKTQHQTLMANSDVDALPEATTPRRTFADLVMSGEIGQGKPLILGTSQDGPEYRSLESVKTMAVTGHQGSGKTLSIVYLIASCLLAYAGKILITIFDPHWSVSESLAWYVRPLINAGLVKLIPTAQTPKAVQELNTIVDLRIAGKASCDMHMLTIFDELGRLSRLACFPALMQYLDKSTEDTRKVNVTTIGIAHKWTARHFNNRADIRSAMNSFWIHKTKPSNAKLLMEDLHEGKTLLKQLHEPGQGILVTDYSDPKIVQTPWINPAHDLHTVIDLVQNHRQPSAYTVPAEETQQRQEPLLDVFEIQRQIRALPDSQKDIWAAIFDETEMKFSTFQKKVKDPGGRPWTPEEQARISKWIQNDTL